MYDDLIKRLRDAAKMSDALFVLLPHSDGNAVANLYREAADAIEALSKRVDESIPKSDAEIIIEELSKPRWIPVTERLPEKYVSVWTYSKFGMLQDEYIGEYDGEKYFARQTTHVTHWQPLPEPPKEET